jgi:S-adenosylhomocysteine hydrolase
VVSTRIDWVREHCRLLRGIADEFGRTRPFDGLTIGTGIHLEAKTVALLLTLRDGGARLVSTGNLNTTQPDAVGRLRAEGVTVIGEPTKDSQVHAAYLSEVLAAEPDLILDNGGEPVRHVSRPPVPGTAGRDRGDDLGPDAARAATEPAQAPGPGHQRQLGDGRRIHLLARGHMFNLAGPRPLGNSIESMDLGFALQARCLEAVARGSVDAASCVVPVPGPINADVARSYLDRKYPG